MRFAKLMGVIFFVTLICNVSAFSCDRDFSDVEVEQGEWGYYPIICIGNESIKASYIGDLNDKMEVTVSEKDSHEYMIALIIDASDVEEGRYEGKVNLYDENGSKFITLDVNLQVGEGERKEISLSRDSIRFQLEEEEQEDCYIVRIKNTGNVVLDGLEAEIRTWDDDCEWMRISDIEDETLGVGEVEKLEICVNNYDNYSSWKERKSTVRIKADGVIKDIDVYLFIRVEDVWRKKYDELHAEHDFLWRTYLREHNYMIAWESLNKSYTSLTENYTNLLNNYADLTINYETLQEDYTRLEDLFAELKINHTREITKFKDEIDKARNSLRDLNEEIAEKDMMIKLFERKYGGENKSTMNKTSGITGNVLKTLGGLTPYWGIGLIASVLAITLFMGRDSLFTALSHSTIGARLKFRGKELEGEIQKEKPEKSPSSGASLFDERELQKEKLKNLLMKKLVEKSSNENV